MAVSSSAMTVSQHTKGVLMRQMKYHPCTTCGDPVYADICWKCRPDSGQPYVDPTYEKPQFPYFKPDTRQNPPTPQLEVSSKDAVILVYIAGHYLKNPKVGDVLLKTLSKNAQIVADKLIKALVA